MRVTLAALNPRQPLTSAGTVDFVICGAVSAQPFSGRKTVLGALFACNVRVAIGIGINPQRFIAASLRIMVSSGEVGEIIDYALRLPADFLLR